MVKRKSKRTENKVKYAKTASSAALAAALAAVLAAAFSWMALFFEGIWGQGQPDSDPFSQKSKQSGFWRLWNTFISQIVDLFGRGRLQL